ncbi:MAG: phosphohistidine phosphatase [Verrucomicrobiales bacterium]|jgi:phosphohistidine phosphatase
MKRLTIIRHAKSSWASPQLDDYDRPLNQRGKHVAPLMGEALSGRIGKPDVIVSSTALRARTTAGIIAEKLGYADGDIVDERQIYCATESRLLQVLRGIDESHGSAVLFGHFPGVHDLTNTLCQAADIGHFPTCAAAIIELDLDHWGEIDPNTGRLIEFLIPKETVAGA